MNSTFLFYTYRHISHENHKLMNVLDLLGYFLTLEFLIVTVQHMVKCVKSILKEEKHVQARPSARFKITNTSEHSEHCSEVIYYEYLINQYNI